MYTFLENILKTHFITNAYRMVTKTDSNIQLHYNELTLEICRWVNLVAISI